MAVVPNSNVNLATNIRDVLNGAGGSVTNDVLTFFSEDAHINMWAKNKPVRYDSDFALTDAQKRSVNYGLSVPTAKSSADATKTDKYEYLMPRGRNASYKEPYRLPDFCLYDSSCIKPVNVNGNIELNIVFNDSIDIHIQNISQVQSAYGLSLGDFAFLDSFYPAIQLSGDTLSSPMYKTASATFANGGAGSFEISRNELNSLADGTVFNYYLSATSVAKTSFSEANKGAAWYMLPNETIEDVSGTITVRRNFPITMTPISIYGGTTTNDRLMVNADNFVGVMPSGGGSSYYYPVENTYTPQLKYTLKNTASYKVTLYASWFRTDFSKNFYSSDGVDSQPIKMFDGDTEIDSVTLDVGESKNITFMFNTGVLKMNSSGTVQGNITTGQMIEVGISFSYNDVDNLRTTLVRFRN